jgi:hypothetical protein
MSREQALKALSSATECARGIAEDTKQSASDRIAAAHAVVQACAMYARLEEIPKPVRVKPDKPEVEWLSWDEHKQLMSELEFESVKPSTPNDLAREVSKLEQATAVPYEFDSEAFKTNVRLALEQRRAAKQKEG